MVLIGPRTEEPLGGKSSLRKNIAPPGSSLFIPLPLYSSRKATSSGSGIIFAEYPPEGQHHTGSK